MQFWWLIPFVGFWSWLGLFVSIVRKHYRGSFLESVTTNASSTVRFGLMICFFTMLNLLLWIATGRGIIVNMLQQALLVVLQLSIFKYSLNIFDPLQRHISRIWVRKGSNLTKLVLGVSVLVLSVLVRVGEVYDVESFKDMRDDYAFYFLTIDFLLGVFACGFMWIYFNMYVTIRRGLKYSSSDKPPDVIDLRKRWMIDKIDLKDFSHKKDPDCTNVLKLEKIMIERYMFYMFMVFAMNLYKLSWGSSQYECSSRVSCTPSITEEFFQHFINSLSYWMPDLIYVAIWFFLLVKPIDQVILPEERTSETFSFSGNASFSTKERPTIDQDVSASGIKLSEITNPMAPEMGKSENYRVANNFVHEFQELSLSCQELILFHRESGIPVATLFSGRDTFAVLYLHKEGIDNRNSVTSRDWIEIGRSDCRINMANPLFRVAFIVPSMPQLHATYKIELYNVEENADSTFHPDTAVLANQELIASVLFSQEELNDWKEYIDTENQLNLNDEAGDIPQSDKSRKRKHVVISNIPIDFSELYTGTGGKILISARKVNPFCQCFSDLYDVNDVFRNIIDKADDGGKTMSVKFQNKAIIRSFLTSTVDQNLGDFSVVLREELVETPCSFDVPIAYLLRMISQRESEMKIIVERLGLGDAQINVDENGDDWSLSFVNSIKESIEVMKEAIQRYENTAVSFKKSAEKKVKELEFVPVNLHLQMFSISSRHETLTDGKCDVVGNESNDTDKEFVCDFVTVGAFTAHSRKFKQGGLWHLLRQFEYRLRIISPDSKLWSSDNNGDEVFSPHHIWNADILEHFPMDPLLLHLAFKIRVRFDVCASQCLASVAAGFIARVKVITPLALERAVTIGMLFQFESLLSTQGHELGMISDYYCAVKFLEFVQIRVHKNENYTIGMKEVTTQIYEDGDVLVMDLGYSPELYNELPELLQRGCRIDVVPVMFTVGVNELQTYAERVVGKKALFLQDLINRENLTRVENYYSLALSFENGELENERKELCTGISNRLSRKIVFADMNKINVDDSYNRKSSLYRSSVMSRGSIYNDLNVVRERVGSVNISKDIDISSATWRDMEKALGGFSLWTGHRKKNSDVRPSMAVIGEDHGYLEDIDDNDYHTDLQKELYMLAKEQAQLDLTLRNSKSNSRDSGQNDIEAGKDNVNVDYDSSLWQLNDDEDYEHTLLEKNLEFFTEVSESDKSRSLSDVSSVSDAIKRSRISFAGKGSSVAGVACSREDRMNRLLNRLRNHVELSQGCGGKPFQILIDAAKLTRALDGVRFTSCKSAKDRTGMSVTLEEVQLAQEIYGLNAVEAKNILLSLRQHGVRLANAKKNVGKACFSFNRFQRKFLPAVYQPPLNVMGKVDS